MGTIRFQVHQADGGLWSIEGTQEHLFRYVSLVGGGLTGKALIDGVLGDDLGTKPVYVVVSMVSDSGMPLSRSHRYD